MNLSRNLMAATLNCCLAGSKYPSDPPPADNPARRPTAPTAPAGVWQLVSDNPDKLTWPNRPWPPDAEIVGEVRWIARTLS